MAFRASGEPPTTQIAFDAGNATRVATDALILLAPTDDGAWSGALAEVDAALDGALRQALTDAEFKPKVGATHDARDARPPAGEARHRERGGRRRRRRRRTCAAPMAPR